MFKDNNGTEIRVGDVMRYRWERGELSDITYEVVELPRPGSNEWHYKAGSYAGVVEGFFAEEGGRIGWVVVSRADGSSPAPTPTEGERWVPGAVWWSPAYGLRFVVKEQHEVEPLFFSFWPNGESGGQQRRKKDSEALMNRTYAGNLSAVFAGLVRLHARGGYTADEFLALDLRKPAPVVDAETLAAKQRAAHRAESEALTKRYEETFLPAVAEAVKGTRVRAVSDCVHGHSSGKPFMVELSVDGVHKTLFFAAESTKWAVMTDINQAMLGFAGELGSRLLKGGGKG